MIMKKISIVIPCLNEEGNIAPLAQEISKNIPSKYDYEIIFVDDGSTDNTRPEIIRLSNKNKKIKGIFVYKRTGHQQALRSGIINASGDAIITMDADFQHPPSYIPQMITLWEAGHDTVIAQKMEDRHTSMGIRIARNFGYKLWSFAAGEVLTPRVSDFRLIDRNIANAIAKSKERVIFLRGMVRLFAKDTAILPYNVGKRKFGKSSYTLTMFFNMFVNGLLSFSSRPLRLIWGAGLLLCIITAIYVISDILITGFLHRTVIEGWKTLVLLIVILNGFMIMYMGFLGEYISIIFKEIKGREQPIVYDTVNLPPKSSRHRR